jgi:opacity protein-like surface antigen
MKSLFAIAVYALIFSSPANAAIVDFPPGLSGQGNGSFVGAQEHVGQSFVAQDQFVNFGFYLANRQFAGGSYKFAMALIEGDGLSGKLLSIKNLQFDLELDLAFFSPIGLRGVAFDDYALTLGKSYTVQARPITASGTVGFDSIALYLYNRFDSRLTPYEGGRFYRGQSSFDVDAGYFTAFRMEGIAGAVTAVPEVGTWAMMIAGFGIVGGALRRRGIKKDPVSA